MRKTLIAFLLALPVPALAGTLQTAVLDVQKMTCALCSITVRKALEKVPGVALGSSVVPQARNPNARLPTPPGMPTVLGLGYGTEAFAEFTVAGLQRV